MHYRPLRLLLFLSLCVSLPPPWVSGTDVKYGREARATVEAEARVVGGTQATQALPWFALLHPAGQPASVAVCGGTLVTSRHVVTAAHCIPALRQPAVTLGALNRCSRREAGRREMAVASVTTHPNYVAEADGGLGLNDIAVLTLRAPATGFQVAKLPPSISGAALTEIFPGAGGAPSQVVSAGQTALVAGFGLQREDDRRSQPCILRMGNVRVLSRNECARSRIPPVYSLEPTLICAGLRRGGVDTCSGDSGGGLMIKEDRSVTLIGIVSFGYGCANRRTPGLYTRVASFMPWLLQQLGDSIQENERDAKAEITSPNNYQSSSPWEGYLWNPYDRWNAWWNPGK